MKVLLPSVFVAIGFALSAGCGQVPEVERGLQTLHFDSNTYVVQSGDTLESIAFRYNLEVGELAALNNHVRSDIYPGDRLVVKRYPGPVNDASAFTGQGWYRGVVTDNARGVERVASAAIPHRTSENLEAYGNEIIPDDAKIAEIQANFRSGTLREEIIPDDLDVRTPQPVPRASPSIAAAEPAWLWPSNGEIARDYAPDEINGQGLDIAGLPGQDVRAAADGTVIYTGRDLSDSGNLVIVRHADGLLTTYSHTRDLYVAEDDFVRAGDPIASLGWNSKRESVLHFEVRKDGKPVNPRLFLPAR